MSLDQKSLVDDIKYPYFPGHSATRCLFIGAFKSFTFKIIVDRYVVIPILLFTFFIFFLLIEVPLTFFILVLTLLERESGAGQCQMQLVTRLGLPVWSSKQSTVYGCLCCV